MDTRLYLADIEPLYDEAVYNAYFEMMPHERRDRTLRYKSEKDRVRSVAAYALLSKAYNEVAPLCGYRDNGCLPSIGYYPSGKSYLVGCDIHFNLSHSGRRVLCSIGLYENGCDIECKRNKSEGVAKRFFNSREYEYICERSNEDNLFTRVWTLKESVLKACGMGISYPMDSFCVVDESGIAKKVLLSDDLGVYYIKNYPADESHEMSCACREDSFEENVRKVQL